MSNRPYMQFYPADYLADTGHLTTLEHGAYLLLIMHYWANRGLPKGDDRLARIARLSLDDWSSLASTVLAFFDDIGGEWRHGRMDADMAELDEKRERLSIAGQKGGKASARARQSSTEASSQAEPLVQQPSSILASSSLSSSLPSSDSFSFVEEGKKELVERAPRAFDQFWATYPHKVGKHDAAKAFGRVMKSGRVTLEALMAGLARYVAKTDDRPWCNPATWLNQGRWEDQPAPEVRNGGSVLAAADRLIDQFGGRAAARSYIPGSEGPKPLSLDHGAGAVGLQRLSEG